MTTLTGKLTLAFLVVGLTGIALVAVFVGLRTRAEFHRFVLDRHRNETVEVLADFYLQNDGWSGVTGLASPDPHGRHGWRNALGPPLVLVDASGTVLLGGRRFPQGTALNPVDLDQAVPIEVDGQVVGRVLFPAPPGQPAELAFLARVNQAILLGALGAMAVALALGGLLARTITRPVRALTAAAHRVAEGELGTTVEVAGRDEIGELAAAFNRMSADLAQASRARRQMTADIAHDLRTPVTVLLGYTEGLADGKFKPDARVYASMHEEAQHLAYLIDDLRTLSLADAGELALQRQPTPPRALLDRAAAAHGPLAAARGVALAVDLAPNLPEVEVDPERMAQVLGNLIGNALRHTPSGGRITLSAVAAGGEGASGSGDVATPRTVTSSGSDADRAILLRVADNGEGIAAEDLPHVFTRHYRGDKARQRAGDETAGTAGLGLAIAKSLVEAHGGTIGVASTLGAGTTVTIRLPLRGFGIDGRPPL